jgi:hypothetical protein
MAGWMVKKDGWMDEWMDGFTITKMLDRRKGRK